MTCIECGHDNGADAKFCSECGTPLAMRCPSCASPQPTGAKFCNQCGTPLAAAPSEQGDPAAVRKSLTAVFVDLVGSTAFGERLDPEAVRAALAPYHDLVRATVEAHDGTLVKFMGDGAMAVFGLPEVAEDDAIRAVTAGVDLQRRFRRFADEVRDRYGVELGLRVGINSGEIVVADTDADLVGDVLNTAARLESTCEPGAVLIGEDTWRLTRSVFELEVLGEVRVRGKADPITTYRVVDEGRSIADEIPFVGRGAELGELVAAFEAARESPVTRLVTVIGAPGVGKTRLAAELRATVDARSFDLRFERRGSTTFTPVAQLLREVTDGSAAAVERLFAGHPDATRLVPVVQSLLGHVEPRSTEESFWAVRRLLEHLAATEPLVVVVDDIQWAEPLFWDLLDHLVEWAQAPVLLVALARPELRELRPELAQPGRRVAAAIALEGLDESATQELAARLLGAEELPGELLERIPESTEGNPLFVRELVQMLVDDGTLEQDGNRWRLTIDADAIEVPPTILSLLATRVERLPDDERRLVELASVIGTDFDRGSLAAIASAEVSDRLGALLDRLRRKDLVEPSGAWAGDHPVYRFHHVLVRDAAYRRLLKGRRADLHEAVGRHAAASTAPSGELDIVVAHHFEQAVRYRRELGTVDTATGELAAAAVDRLRRAVGEALEREDLPAAGGYARRALDLVDGTWVDGTDAARDELLLLGCEALLSSGDVGAATPLVEELHGRSGDERLAAWADCFRAQRWQLTDPDRLTEAGELADDAAGRLDALDDQSGVAKARLVRAGCLARLGRVGDCEAELDLALGAARAAGDRRRTVAVLGVAPLAALWGPSPVARAGGRCLDVLRLLRITTASPAVEATSIRCQGMLESLRGRFDGAREKLAAARATAQELGLRQGLFETELFAGFVELWAEQPVAAEPHLRAAHAGLGRLGIGADAGQAAALLARAVLQQGRVDEADVLAAGALETAGQNLQTAIAAGAALAEVRLAQGRRDEAERLIDEAIRTAGRTDRVLDHALVLLAAARIADAAGDEAAARRHGEAAGRLLAAKGVDVGSPGASRPTEQHAPLDPMATAPAGSDEPDDPAALAGRCWTAVVRGELDEARRLLAPDVHIEYRQRLAGGVVLTVDEYLDNLDAIAREGLVLTSTGELARRGPELVLTRGRILDDDTVSERHMVAQASAGRLSRIVVFDGSQLHEAHDELDRCWTAGRADPVVEHTAAMRRALAAGHPAEIRELLTDDFVALDHRSRGFEPRDADAWAASAADWPPDLTTGRSTCTAVFREIVDHDERRWLSRLLLVIGGDELEMLSLDEFRDGRLSRHEMFDLDDLEQAQARFDELQRRQRGHGAPPPPDDPTASGPSSGDPLRHRLEALTDRFATHFFDDEFDTIRDEVFEPDFVRVDRRAPVSFPTVGLDELRAAALAFEGGPPSVRRGPILAVRPNAYLGASVTAYPNGDENERLVVVVAGPTGRFGRLVVFDRDDRRRALAELDRAWVERGGRIDPMVGRLTQVMSDGPFHSYAALLAPEFVCIDHRELGFATRARDRFLATTEPLVGNVDAHDAVEYVGVDDGIALVRTGLTSQLDGSTWELYLLQEHDGERITRWEEFPLTAREEAIARFEARRTGRATITLENEATRMHDRLYAAGVRHDEAGVRELLHPRATHDSRRWHGLRPVEGREAFTRHFLESTLVDGDASSERESLALRGNELALSRTVFRFDDDEIVYLSLIELRDGLVHRMTTSDESAIDDALDELDRRWQDGGGPEWLVRFARLTRRALQSGDSAQMRAGLTDDFVSVDRRRLGMPSRDADTCSRSMADIGPGTIGFASKIIDLGRNCSLHRIHLIAPDGREWELLHVSEFDGHRMRRLHVFDLDQLAEARAVFAELDDLAAATTRFDELRAGAATDAHTAPPPLVNDGVRLLDRMLDEWIEHGEVDADRYFEPGMTLATRRRSMPESDDGVEMMRAVIRYWAEVGLMSGTNRAVAVRGDRLALCEHTITMSSGDEIATLLVVELGPTGRGRRLSMFDVDQLHDALDLLDEWWEESGGPSSVVAIERATRRAFTVAGIDRDRHGFADDFVTVDHRRVGLGTRGLTDLLASAGLMTPADLVVPQYVDIDDGVCCYEVRCEPHADRSSWHALHVARFDADGLHEVHVFGLDQFDDARRLFDELVTSSS